MIHFYEQFGELIKAERKSRGLTQEAFADALGVEYGTYKRWERGARKFPLDILPAVTQALNSALLISETGEIQIGKGLITMENAFTPDFESFNVKDTFDEFMASRQALAQTLYERAQQAYQKCSEAGWRFMTSMGTYPLGEAEPTANHLESGSQYQFIPDHQESWETPVLTAMVGFDLSGDWFNLPRFMKDLSATYGADLAHFVEKVWVYGCLKEFKGAELFNWIYFKQDTDSLIRLFPLLAQWAPLIAEQAKQTTYIEKYEGLMPDYDWYGLLNIIDEYQDQEFLLNWELPNGELIEVDDVDTLRTFDDLIETALIVIQEDYATIQADYETSCE